MISSISSRVVNLRNVILVVIATICGFLFPQFAVYTEMLAMPLVIFLVFSSIQDLYLEGIDIRTHSLLIGASLCISYVLLPFGGMQIVSELLRGDAIIGFGIILSLPTTAGSAVIWTRLSNADVELSTLISITSLLVAPVVTPLVLVFIAGVDADFPLYSTVTNLAIIVFFGLLLKLIIPLDGVSEKSIDNGAGVAILILIYTSIGGLEPILIQIADVVSLVLISFLLLAMGFTLAVVAAWLLSLDIHELLPIFYTGTFKNLGIAILISFSFSSYLIVLVIVIYYVSQQFAGAIISDLIS